LFFTILFIYGFLFLRCFHEMTYVPVLAQYQVVHIVFYGTGTDTVSAKISLCDTAGKEFAVIDRSWRGQDLTIDFASACFSGKTLLFPYRIYPESENSQYRRGTMLGNYYMESNKCLLLGTPCSDRQRIAMYRIGMYAFMQTSKIQSAFSRVYSVDLSECRMGNSYSIVTGSDGSLSLVQM